MKTEEKRKQIQVILRSNRFKKFEAIKTAQDLNSDVDVVRYCIDKTFKALNNEEIDFRPELKQVIDNLLRNEYLKSKHLVFNLNDVVNAALHEWAQARRAEISLHSFSFRKELPEDEQRVALVFIEQQINYDRGMSFDDLRNFLEGMGEVRIRKILNKFLRYNLLEQTVVNDIEYFYATPP